MDAIGRICLEAGHSSRHPLSCTDTLSQFDPILTNTTSGMNALQESICQLMCSMCRISPLCALLTIIFPCPYTNTSRDTTIANTPNHRGTCPQLGNIWTRASMPG